MKLLMNLAAASVLVLGRGACDDLDTRKCPLIATNGSDAYILDYELLIPSDCPVPLGSAGEWKRAGARVLDYGNRDFRYAEARVDNSDGQRMARRASLFRTVGQAGLAEPATEYQAGTGGSLGTSLDRRYDYGFFSATNNPAGSTTFDPYAEVKITYAASAMANVIDGTSIPPRNSTASWSAAVTGGTPPYSFYWYRDGALVANSQSYTGHTGTENFWLRVSVVDQTMTERVAVMPVDVGGVLTRIDGPQEGYVYTDGSQMSSATWTAAVQGGTPPFTYQWYRDGYPTGSDTSSHTEYFAEPGSFTLGVEVRDATGKFAADVRPISVAYSCSGCNAY
ncbi:MAG: hypothetical protein KY467_10085 [Gemmatimonadetes bacterium]|nr:hypothetical protein [Gemmatimonadota bacterium]